MTVRQQRLATVTASDQAGQAGPNTATTVPENRVKLGRRVNANGLNLFLSQAGPCCAKTPFVLTYFELGFYILKNNSGQSENCFYTKLCFILATYAVYFDFQPQSHKQNCVLWEQRGVSYLCLEDWSFCASACLCGSSRGRRTLTCDLGENWTQGCRRSKRYPAALPSSLHMWTWLNLKTQQNNFSRLSFCYQSLIHTGWILL